MILIATNDLFFKAKIAEVAKQKNVEVKFVDTLDKIIGIVIENNCRLVIVDLNFENFNPVNSIENLKRLEPQIYVIGYLSHVQTTLRDNATHAGCDEVMSRSQFSKNLGEILTRNKL